MGVQSFTPGGGFAPPREPAKPPPVYEERIVTVSLAAFLIYFLVLREENDVDANLSLNRMLGNVADVLDEQEEAKEEEEKKSEG